MVETAMTTLPPLRRLLNAQFRLACAHPFMAPLILNLEFVADPKIPTAATSEACITYYSPAYVAASTDDNLDYTLYHEVLHLFLNYFGRRCGRDNFRWNVAHDLEIAAEVLPKDAIQPSQFTLPSGQLAEWYYPRLPKAVQGCSHYLVSDRDAPCNATQEAIIEVAENIVRGDKAGVGKGLYNQALKIARPNHGNEQLRQIQGALLTAGMSDFSYGRHNRRTAGRGGPILPAMVNHDAHIMCVLDVSGSMEGKTELAAGILLGAVKCVGSGLDVVAWDTHPQSLCNVRTGRDLAKIKYSGGGTNMAAAIKYCVKRGRYDALFIITDCETPWPSAAEGAHLPPVYVLRVGRSGEVPKWMRTIQAD